MLCTINVTDVLLLMVYVSSISVLSLVKNSTFSSVKKKIVTYMICIWHSNIFLSLLYSGL